MFYLSMRYFLLLLFLFQKPKTSRILPKVTTVPKPITDSDIMLFIFKSPISPFLDTK